MNVEFFVLQKPALPGTLIPPAPPVPLLPQVCDFPEGPTEGSPGAVAERRPRMQLAGRIPIREWPLPCKQCSTLSATRSA